MFSVSQIGYSVFLGAIILKLSLALAESVSTYDVFVNL